MKIIALNHVGLHASDVPASIRFYTTVLKLQEIPRPAFDFPGAWFRLGTDQELHLIGRAPVEPSSPRERHTALLIDDPQAWSEHLKSHGLEFYGPKPRPDGAIQIFLRDPDGHVIELCTAVPA